jgi:hypothetical protein
VYDKKVRPTCERTTISLFLFSFSSALFGTLACTGAMLPATPGLLEFGNGLVTLEAAIAAAARLDVASIDGSASSSSALPSFTASEVLPLPIGLVGLKTGAEADIFEALGEGASVDDARRFGGVELLFDMAKFEQER